MSEPMGELFSLPLAVAPLSRDPNWGAALVEPNDGAYVITVNPRTTGGFAAELVVSAIDRAEAIVQAINEYDGMRAERDRLYDALQRIHVWAASYPQAAWPEYTTDDMKAIRGLLRAGGYNLDALCANIMRRVLIGADDIAREGLGIQPCGHPVTAIVQSGEGTAYCGECEEEARE